MADAVSSKAAICSKEFSEIINNFFSIKNTSYLLSSSLSFVYTQIWLKVLMNKFFKNQTPFDEETVDYSFLFISVLAIIFNRHLPAHFQSQLEILYSQSKWKEISWSGVFVTLHIDFATLLESGYMFKSTELDPANRVDQANDYEIAIMSMIIVFSLVVYIASYHECKSHEEHSPKGLSEQNNDSAIVNMLHGDNGGEVSLERAPSDLQETGINKYHLFSHFILYLGCWGEAWLAYEFLFKLFVETDENIASSNWSYDDILFWSSVPTAIAISRIESLGVKEFYELLSAVPTKLKEGEVLDKVSLVINILLSLIPSAVLLVILEEGLEKTFAVDNDYLALVSLAVAVCPLPNNIKFFMGDLSKNTGAPSIADGFTVVGRKLLFDPCNSYEGEFSQSLLGSPSSPV